MAKRGQLRRAVRMKRAPRVSLAADRCAVASAVVLEDGVERPRMLLLRRSKGPLVGEWCHVAGGIEAGETPWQTVLREIREETGLSVSRLYSAEYNEQFYETRENVFNVVPVFVAYVDSSGPIRLNSEHSEHRWVTIAEAQSLVTFGGQRRVYEEVQREFIDRKATPSHEIALT